jgi:hypothetical protein
VSAAVEAAARAWFDRGQAQRLDAGRKRPDGQAWQWEDLTEDDRRAYQSIVEPIVAAASGWTCKHGAVRGEGCDEYGCER